MTSVRSVQGRPVSAPLDWLEGEPLALERSEPIRAIDCDRIVAGAVAPRSDRGVEAPWIAGEDRLRWSECRRQQSGCKE